MLEIRNLTKVYRSKTGESVKALDNVSISFPESGMVFILGKSGSGKSTLLNIMGGLDSYDSGEFIIKGKSSKDFAGSDFDAYRNTFIGFIFQEYNVLDDFTVGANIALALELQGKKATSEKINEILSQVDLLNYAKRKPNELSGGQKQRVAIARALVKEPQIIMADEPTGALDSNTGKQIFDSLKQLSREKLVLIVSHDRDFAERYADRIVELADGKIISDVTKHEHESEKLTEGIDRIGGQILRIRGGYRLTDKDLKMINEYLENNSGDILLSGDDRVNNELRSAAGISERGTMSVFEGTDAEKDVKLKKYEKKDSRFIRSKLPAKNALKMGSGGLKHKKFRLVMTVLLSMIAFAFFGFADSMAAYNKLTSAVDSLADSNVKNASVTVGVRHTTTYADGEQYVYFNNAGLNDEDLAYLRETTGLDFVPVFTGFTGNGYYSASGGFSVASMMKSYAGTEAYTGKLHGLVEFSSDNMENVGYTVTGRLPEKQGEIAVTELLYRQFKEYGFQNAEFKETVAAGALTMDPSGDNSIIGKHITLSNGLNLVNGKGYSFEIVGVVDTQFDYTRYEAFLPEDENAVPGQDEGNVLVESVLRMELMSELNYGFHALGFTTADDIEALSAMMPTQTQHLGTYFSGWKSGYYISVSVPSDGDEDGKNEAMPFDNRFSEGATGSALTHLPITWLDGVDRTELAADEIVLPSSVVENLYPQEVKLELDEKKLADAAIAAGLFDQGAWDATDAGASYYDRLVAAAAQYGQNADHHEAEQSVNEKMVEIAAHLYGFTPEKFSQFRQHVLSDLLRNKNSGDREYTVSRWEIEEILRENLVQKDLASLLTNEKFLQIMLDSEYGSNHISGEWNEKTEDEKKTIVSQFYNQYLSDRAYGYHQNSFGSASGKELAQEARDRTLALSGTNAEEFLSSLVIERFEEDYELQHSTSLGVYDLKVVGVYDSSAYPYGNLIISDTVMSDYQTWFTEHADGNAYFYQEEIAAHKNGIWAYALAPLGTDRDVIRRLVEMSYDESGDLQFALQNSVMDTLNSFNEFIEVGAKVFLYVGIGFAVFSALLLMNFISTSISYKKREIGVLRAVGARSSDVFKIFFSEALIIALINFVMSTVLVVAGIGVANSLMHRNGITITLLHYGIRQFILMLVISVAVALIASFLPVNNIAKKKPVDAIKDR